MSHPQREPRPLDQVGRKAELIKLVHIARAQLGMDDGTYRAIIGRHSGGKASSKDLATAELLQVMAHMEAAGFVRKDKAGTPKPGARGRKYNPDDAWRFAPQQGKLRAMWYALADAGAVDDPRDARACDDAIEVWAKRQLSTANPPLDALRFVSGPQMAKLVEALKAWGQRVGAHVI